MTLDACWRSIGVHGGDHSCERLADVIHCRNCPVFTAAARSLFAQAAEVDGDAVDLVEAPNSSFTALLFRLGDQWLALRSGDLAEVAEGRRVSRLPHRSGGYLEGVVNVRGEVHLCVAIGAALGGERLKVVGADQRLLLMRSGSGFLAFRASQVLGLRAFDQGDMVEPPDNLPEGLRVCARGVLPDAERAPLLLDGPALLQALERALFS